MGGRGVAFLRGFRVLGFRACERNDGVYKKTKKGDGKGEGERGAENVRKKDGRSGRTQHFSQDLCRVAVCTLVKRWKTLEQNLIYCHSEYKG